MRRKKKNNNLILVNVGESKKLYFTSLNRAGDYLGILPNSVNWAIAHRNELVNNNGDKVTIELVDGSDITYSQINNE